MSSESQGGNQSGEFVSFNEGAFQWANATTWAPAATDSSQGPSIGFPTVPPVRFKPQQRSSQSAEQGYNSTVFMVLFFLFVGSLCFLCVLACIRSRQTLRAWEAEAMAEQNRRVNAKENVAKRKQFIEQTLIVTEFKSPPNGNDGETTTTTTTAKIEKITPIDTQSLAIPSGRSITALPRDSILKPGMSAAKDSASSDSGVLRSSSSSVTEYDALDDVSLLDDDFSGCAICLCNFANRDLVGQSNNVSCPHTFHKDCIVLWLQKHDECPSCRQAYLLVDTV